MTGRRGLLVAVVGAAVAGAVVLLVAGRTWGRAALAAQAGAHVAVSASGHDAVPALPALGFALLALAAAVVAARSWLRAVVGVVTLVIGGVVVALAGTSTDDVAAALRRKAFGVPGSDVHASLSGWAVVTVVAGAIAVTTGVVIVVRGAAWPGLGARYEAPDGEARPTARPVEPTTAAWDALDRGEDPTA